MKRYKIPWLDDPLEWPRELRKPGTEVVLAADAEARIKELEAQVAKLTEARDLGAVASATMRDESIAKSERIATLEARLREAITLLIRSSNWVVGRDDRLDDQNRAFLAHPEVAVMREKQG